MSQVKLFVYLETALRPSPVTPQRPPPCPGPRGLHLAPGFAYTTSSSTIPRPTRELQKQAPHGRKRPQLTLSLAGRLVLQGYDFSLVRSKLHTGYTSRSTIIHHLLICGSRSPFVYPQALLYTTPLRPYIYPPGLCISVSLIYTVFVLVAVRRAELSD